MVDFRSVAACFLLGIGAIGVLGGCTEIGQPAGSLTGGSSEPAVAPRLVETVKVNEGYPTAAFIRAFYVEATDRIAVTFGTGDYTKVKMGQPGGCQDAHMGYAYREFTAEMKDTGKTGYFAEFPVSCAAGDAASVMAGGSYYFLGGANSGPGTWKLRRFDSNWRQTGTVDVKLDERTEAMNDQMLAYAGGQLIAGSLYVKDGIGSGPLDQKKTDPTKGEATFQKLFTLDLKPAGARVLDDTPHINGSSLVEANGVYNLVTSRAFFGDLIVLQYDKNWKFSGEKKLAEMGQWSQGAVYEDGRFYVAYVDVSVKGASNIALGVYDRDWNLLSTTAVTSFGPEELKGGGRPSVMKHGNHLYVSYDVMSFSGRERAENKDWQGYVAIYEM